MRLASAVLDLVNSAKIDVFYADRGMTEYWNKRRHKNELRYFSGWYWYQKRNGRVASNDHGPFRSKMAAYRDCYQQMQMRI